MAVFTFNLMVMNQLCEINCDSLLVVYCDIKKFDNFLHIAKEVFILSNLATNTMFRNHRSGRRIGAFI